MNSFVLTVTKYEFTDLLMNCLTFAVIKFKMDLKLNIWHLCAYCWPCSSSQSHGISFTFPNNTCDLGHPLFTTKQPHDKMTNVGWKDILHHWAMQWVPTMSAAEVTQADVNIVWNDGKLHYSTVISQPRDTCDYRRAWDAWEVNQTCLSCDWGFCLGGMWQQAHQHHTQASSYKLIQSNNNPCPHLLQHALPVLAIDQQIPSAASCEVEVKDGRGRIVIVMLCNWQVCLNAVFDADTSTPIPLLGSDNKHVGSQEWENTCQDDRAIQRWLGLFSWLNTHCVQQIIPSMCEQYEPIWTKCFCVSYG